MDLNEHLKDLHFVGIIRPEKKNVSSKKNPVPSTSSGHTIKKPHPPINSRIVQNFILVWLDSRFDEMNGYDSHSSITELQRIVNTIKTFADVDQCIDFLSDVKEEKVLMIISDQFSRTIMPLVHDIAQIHSIYIFGKDDIQHKQWSKVKGVFTAISFICVALKKDAQRYDQDSISISFVSKDSGKLSENLDQLDPTFMYTQILKEILLTINFSKQHTKDFTDYYRENFADNTVQLNNIDEFERDYDGHSSVRWYTHDCCLYSVLNRALRLMEVDTIIKMGFFIHDLHHQIADLHSAQFNEDRQLEPFTVYRGQSLSTIDFDRMSETQGGLISFNNFLSTSKDRTVALAFARSALTNPALVGIVFVMQIDPRIKSTPFASINDASCYKTEDEILFSMHTIFRIGNMTQTYDDNRLWYVDLIQTADNDRQLNDLTVRIRDEIRGANEWDKLGKLLIKLGQYTKVDELYDTLVKQTNDGREKAQYYHQLGWSKQKQNKYSEAVTFYEQSLATKMNFLPPNHTSLAVSYNDIGSVYEKMEEYSQALLYYEKGLEIQQDTSSLNRSGLASSCSKIGSIYEKLGDYAKALLFHEKAVEIREKLRPPNKAVLAISYNNIGSVYEKMNEYAKALSSHEKALKIQQTTLPSNHPDIAQSHSHLGFVYGKMRQYSKACQFHQEAVNIGQQSLPINHPRLQQWRKNLDYAKRKCH